jgi:hypothetical protein
MVSGGLEVWNGIESVGGSAGTGRDTVVPFRGHCLSSGLLCTGTVLARMLRMIGDA